MSLKPSFIQSPNGYNLVYNDKPIVTPKKNAIVLPTLRLAEYFTQKDFMSNPLRKHLFTILDLVTEEKTSYKNRIIEKLYYDTCFYWSKTPDDLYQKQETQWGPILREYAQNTNVLMPAKLSLDTIELSDTLCQFFDAWLERMNSFELFAAHELVSELHSTLLTHMFLTKKTGFEAIFELAFLEELHQISLWGKTPEQEQRLNHIQDACILLESLYVMSNPI